MSRSHDRSNFSCGVEELDEYLKKNARRHNKENLNQTKVLVEKGSKDIIGFFSFAATSVASKSFETTEGNKLPNYEIPCIRLTRFAVDKQYQNRGLGRYLLGCALNHALKVSQEIGIYAVIVDAKDDYVKSFYLKNGFYSLLSGLIVYLPLKEIRESIKRIETSQQQKRET
ncbi:MAG: GNAT family N-acetyltransferase [Sphaerochaetaceae bacterium]